MNELKKREVAHNQEWIINAQKMLDDLSKHIKERENKQDGVQLEAGHIVIEYKGRLTKAMKEVNVKKEYNAYGRRCNVVGIFSTNSNLSECSEIVNSWIAKYKLNKLLVATSRLI